MSNMSFVSKIFELVWMTSSKNINEFKVLLYNISPYNRLVLLWF